MRKSLFTACAVGLLATGLATMASADANNWAIYFKAGSGGDYGTPLNSGPQAIALSSTIAGVTDSESVRDTKDGAPAPSVVGAPAITAWFRPGWMNGQTDSTSWPWAFGTDYKTPLNVGTGTPPNLIKTWHDLILWTAPGYTTDNALIHMFVATGITATTTAPATMDPDGAGPLPAQPVVYKLIMRRAPAGYVPGQGGSTMPTAGNGTVDSPYEFLLAAPTLSNPLNGKYLIADIVLPSAGTEAANPINNDGGPLSSTQTAGYRFDFVTPEPGSLMVLASGLTGLVGLISRRRKA